MISKIHVGANVCRCPMANHHLPNYLRARRKSLGFSQEEIAYLLGFHSSRVCRYERFRMKPGFRIAIAFEVIFNSSVRDLFAGDYRTIEKTIRRRARYLLERLKRGKPNRMTDRKVAQLERIIGDGGK